METKTFSIEIVLSAITGILLCNIGDLYDILNFLTGDNLYTHQLPRAGRVCRIALFKQHPFLKEINVDGVNPGNWQERLAEIKSKYQNEVYLEPIENWTQIDPIVELVDMVGKDKVVVIAPPLTP